MIEDKKGTSFYNQEELSRLGLKKYGENVLISRKASIYGAENITIGNNVRIDDFSILSGKISLGSNIHIAAYCALYGGATGISMDDFSGLSARVTIYAAIDDFNGEYLVSPVVDETYRKLIKGKVELNKYVQIGANCVILPNIIIGEGTAVGAMSFVNRSLQPWKIYVGTPAEIIKDRSKGLLRYVLVDNE